MMLSTFALVLAVLEFLVGFPLLFFPGKTTSWMLTLTRTDPLYRTIGALFLVICVLVLAEGMAVGTDVAGLIRLVVWFGAIRSLLICWSPELHARWAERVLSGELAQRLFGAIAIAAGFLFASASAALR